MDYRKRCYQSYVSKYGSLSLSLSPRQFEHLKKIYHLRFHKIIPHDKNSSILDAACGAGYFLYYLQKEGYVNATGIDLSAEQLAIANRLGITNVQLANVFEFLPKHPATYELIVANDIIEHLTKDEVLKFLDLIFLALKPGGKLLLTTVNVQSLFGAAAFHADFTHETGFTANSLAQVLRICNFIDVTVAGEEAIIYDFKSALRASLWRGMRKLLKLYVAIERGGGRGMWKMENIFEPRMYAVATKPFPE